MKATPRRRRGWRWGAVPLRKGKASAKAQKQGSAPGGAGKQRRGWSRGEGASLGLSAGVRLRGSVEKLGLRFGGRWRAWDSSE